MCKCLISAAATSGFKAYLQLMVFLLYVLKILLVAFSRNGRPGSQQVTEKFMVDWGSYMSSRNDVVYVKLDVAGARGLPRALLRGRLGGVEVADQLAVIRWVLRIVIYEDVR